MSRRDAGKPLLTAGDAVAQATRMLRFQIDLGNCSVDIVKDDSFVAGYLWGFCGGIVSGLRANSPGLYALHSMVCRELFGDRDAASLVEHVARIMDTAEFREGERSGMADAHRSLLEGRAAGGLVAHLAGARSRSGDVAAGDPPE
jgi:hypothetical protein